MKVERHSKIVELIGKYEIETQEELAERLNEAGFNVTQATVSRDIRELKLTKMQSESGIWIATSVLVSTDEVASSRIRISALSSSARAMAIRCF